MTANLVTICQSVQFSQDAWILRKCNITTGFIQLLFSRLYRQSCQWIMNYWNITTTRFWQSSQKFLAYKP